MSMGKRASRWIDERVITVISRAAAAGHDVNDLRRRPSGPGVQGGTYAECSCGWSSTPRGRTSMAAAAGLWHALEVVSVLDERKRLDGVEWTPAPPTTRLLAALDGVSLLTSHDEAS